MSKRDRDAAGAAGQSRRAVNEVNGIPDRSLRPAVWKYAVLTAVFLAWVGFLVYCQLAGRPAT